MEKMRLHVINFHIVRLLEKLPWHGWDHIYRFVDLHDLLLESKECPTSLESGKK
jgi:hypothetical protein